MEKLPEEEAAEGIMEAMGAGEVGNEGAGANLMEDRLLWQLEDAKGVEIFREADFHRDAPWQAELTEDELAYIRGISDAANVGQAFSFLRSLYKLAGKYAFAAKCDSHSLSNIGCLSLLAYLFRRTRVGEVRDIISILQKPKVEVTDAKVDKLKAKFLTLKDFFNTSKATFVYPKIRYCTEEYLVQILGGRKNVYREGTLLKVNMPRFPELDFALCVEKWGKYPLVVLATPDRIPHSKSYDRTFFFNIVNTAYPHSMTELLMQIRARRREEEIAAEVEYQEYSAYMELYLRSMPNLPPGTESHIGSRKKRKRALPYRAAVEVLGKVFEINVV